MKKKIFVVFLLFAGIATALFANRYTCEQNLNEIARLLESKGFEVNFSDSRFGYLNQGDAFGVRVTCYAGVQYAIVAAGGDEAIDVDVAVADNYGNVISKDTKADRFALAPFTPSYTGTYIFAVKLHSCSTAGDYVGYLKAYLP